MSPSSPSPPPLLFLCTVKIRLDPTFPFSFFSKTASVMAKAIFKSHCSSSSSPLDAAVAAALARGTNRTLRGETGRESDAPRLSKTAAERHPPTLGSHFKMRTRIGTGALSAQSAVREAQEKLPVFPQSIRRRKSFLFSSQSSNE